MAPDWWKTCNRWIGRKFFSSGLRIDLYRALSMLLKNQVKLNDALNALYAIYSKEGRQPETPAALFISDAIMSLESGHPVSKALVGWVPLDEALILQAGEEAGKLADAFAEAESLILAQAKIRGAVIGALAYPIVLFGLTGFLLHLVATDLVPKLIKVVDPKLWRGAAGILYHVSMFVNQYGFLLVLCIVVAVAVIFGSLGTLSGKARILLDKVPPWSVYRMIFGATFLLNISALLKAGIQLNVALDRLLEVSNRYLRIRIDAVRVQLTLGKNFGEALLVTGYGFPDNKANQFLAIISSYTGLEEALYVFGKQWLEETVAGIQKLSKLVLAIGVSLVGIVMLVVIAGAGGLQDALQGAAN